MPSSKQPMVRATNPEIYMTLLSLLPSLVLDPYRFVGALSDPYVDMNFPSTLSSSFMIRKIVDIPPVLRDFPRPGVESAWKNPLCWEMLTGMQQRQQKQHPSEPLSVVEGEMQGNAWLSVLDRRRKFELCRYSRSPFSPGGGCWAVWDEFSIFRRLGCLLNVTKKLLLLRGRVRYLRRKQDKTDASGEGEDWMGWWGCVERIGVFRQRAIALEIVVWVVLQLRKERLDISLRVGKKQKQLLAYYQKHPKMDSSPKFQEWWIIFLSFTVLYWKFIGCKENKSTFK